MPADCYEIIVVEQGNSPGEARNIGINRAIGRYILFVDADDYLIDDKLSYCIELLYTHQPDILSFGFTKNINRNGNGSGRVDIYASGAEYMMRHNFHGSVWHNIYRATWLEEKGIRFAEDVYHEDEAFCAKCYAMAGKTIVYNANVYVYCTSANSITSCKDKKVRDKRIDNFHAMLNDLLYFRKSSKGLSVEAEIALDRRISFLTIDYFIQMAHNHRSMTDIKRRIDRLRDEKLLPLPDNDYSYKYTLAQNIINSLTKLL